jgi:Protein of unknown function (DUF2759).
MGRVFIAGAIINGTVIITGLITLLALVALYSNWRKKNFLGLILSLSAAAVFGFFTVMTIVKSAYPLS